MARSDNENQARVVLTNAHQCMERLVMAASQADRGVDDAVEHAPATPPPPAPPDRRPVAYEQAADLLRALAAPVRLALVDLLADAPRCVHELVDALGISQPLVSQHLQKLRAAQLVATERRGREVVYRLSDQHVAHVVRDALTHAQEPASG